MGRKFRKGDWVYTIMPTYGLLKGKVIDITTDFYWVRFPGLIGGTYPLEATDLYLASELPSEALVLHEAYWEADTAADYFTQKLDEETARKFTAAWEGIDSEGLGEKEKYRLMDITVGITEASLQEKSIREDLQTEALAAYLKLERYLFPERYEEKDG